MSAALDILQSILFRNREQHAIPALDGAYSPNNRLEELPELALDLTAPDDLAGDGSGGLYIADAERLLHLASPDAKEATPVATFEAPITALARLADGSLMAAVNGQGLRHVDAQGKELNRLDTLEGRPLRCVTALTEDAGHQGVYFTVGTTCHDAEDWVWDLMECNSDGLLVHWGISGGQPQVLLRGLAYPNGLAVEDNASVLLTQSWSHSLSRYRPDGAVDAVIPNMPGYPARIAPASGGGYWLAQFAMRTQLVELVLRDTRFKHEMMRRVEPELWVRPALKTIGSHLEPLQFGGVKKLGIRKPWSPPRSYGLVVRLDEEYEPVASMHSRVDGTHHGVMAAREIDGRLVVAVKGNACLLSANLEEVTKA